MRKMNLFLSTLTLCGLISFAGCNNTTSNTSSSTSSVSSSIVAAETVTYKFTVKSISGDRVGEAMIEIYKDGKFVAEVMTDLIGNASIDLQKAKYTAKLFDLPKGLVSNKEFEIKEGQNLIEVEAQIIDEDMPSNHRYKLGDVMYDFSFYDMENNKVTLSEVLKENMQLGDMLKWAAYSSMLLTCASSIASFPRSSTYFSNNCMITRKI